MKALLDDNIMAPWRGSEPAAVILGELEISPALPEEMRRVATLLNDEHYLGAVCRGQSTDLACDFSYHPRGLLDRCVEGGLGTPGAVITESIYDAAGRSITRSNGACTRTVTRAANGETLLWGSCVREVISDASSVVLSDKLVSRDANPQPITCTEGYSAQVQQKNPAYRPAARWVWKRFLLRHQPSRLRHPAADGDDSGKPIFRTREGTPSSANSSSMGLRWLSPACAWEPVLGMFACPGDLPPRSETVGFRRKNGERMVWSHPENAKYCGSLTGIY